MKEYSFTLDEIMALRDACIEYRQALKPVKGQEISEGRKTLIIRLGVLADQFKQDAITTHAA